MKTLADAYALAKERNILLATVETWERAVSATPEEKVRVMRELFRIISCADSVVLQESMCAEVARLLIVPARAVLEDYRAWLRKAHT